MINYVSARRQIRWTRRSILGKFISFWILLASGRLLICFTMTFVLSANGNLCGWWSQVDPPWSCAGVASIYIVRWRLVFCSIFTLHLSSHCSWQHYIKLSELEKNRKLNDLLDALDFNQVVIFVKSVTRAAELNKLLVECNFPSICIHSGMSQEERFVSYSFFS